MKAAFRYIAVPEEAYRIAGPHRIIPMDLWAMAHGSRMRTVRVTERQWEPEVSRRHARTVLSDLVTAGLLLVAERGDRGSVYRVVDASTGTFGEDVYHHADRNADHNYRAPTSEPDTNADRNADHARVESRARPTLPYLTEPSEDVRRVETTPSHETDVPQGPAAPAALGPTDPTCDEPDWDALLTAVPMTYDEVDDDEATEAGPVDAPPSAAAVAAGPAALDGGALAPSPDAVPGALADGVRGDGAARPVVTDGCLPLGSVTQPTPVTRATDVDALWEAWRGYGTVRGRPNAHRRAAMARVLRDYPLADLLDMLEAAHTGDGDKWRWLQGATSRSDAVYLRPENLLRPSTIAGRMDDAHDWVRAGRPKHDAAEARVEARSQAAAQSLVTRARAAWDKTVMPNRGSQRRLNELMASWGDSPRADEARRAVLGGLAEARGLQAIGMATEYTRPEKMRAFVRGFVAALGGEVTEAELREVG